MGILKSPANNVSEIVIACKHRHEDDSAYMIGTYDLPSFGSFHHLSSGSTYTSSTLSSFFRDSCSTGSGLDITLLLAGQRCALW